MGFKTRRPRDKSRRAAPLRAALDRAGGNISEAARELGWSRVQLYRLLRRAKVDPSDSRRLARGRASERRPGRSPMVIERLLAALDGNVTAVARALGWSRVHMHRVLSRDGLDAGALRSGTPHAETGASGLARYVAARLRLSPKHATLREARLQLEHVYVLAALALCGGDRQATQRLLDISASSLKEKLHPPDPP